MAKRIACLSSIVQTASGISYSEQVYQIFDSARRYNKEHDIVGIFLVYQDTLLQIFEGNGKELAQVIYRTNRDPRLTQISVIVNQDIESLKFTRWNLKLIHDSSAAHSDYLIKINRLLQPALRLSSTLDKLRYEKLLTRDDTEKPNILPDMGRPNFANTLLSMKSWPRPTALRMDAGLMKICPLLIHKTVSYARLKDLQLFAENEELDQHLLQLHKINALQVTQQEAPPKPHPLHPPKRAKPKNNSSFSQALRQFISQHRTKGGSNP